MRPSARWVLLFLILPACIFYSVSPPAWSFRRWGRRICDRVPAGCCRSSSHRRAFFIQFPRRHGRFAGGGVEFATECPLGAGSCSPRRRAFFIQFPRRHDRFGAVGGEFATECPLGAAVLHLTGVHPRRHDHLGAGGVEFATECPLGAAVLHLTGVHFLFSFPAGMVVSALWEENLRPSARWVLQLLVSPACIFYSVSPPA